MQRRYIVFNKEHTPQEKIVVKYLEKIIIILQPYYKYTLFVGRGSRFCSTSETELDNLAIRYSSEKTILEKVALFLSCKESTDLILEIDLLDLLQNDNLKIEHIIPEECFSLIEAHITECKKELSLLKKAKIFL